MSSTSLESTMLRRLRLHHLKLISELHDSRGVLKTSQRLNLTQPAITKALSDIERALNVTLFERTNRGLKPTRYGDILARHAKAILAQVHHAADEIEDIRIGYSGHVTVGTLLAASASLLPEAIAHLKRDRPELTITVIEGTYDALLPALQRGEIDIVLGRLATENRSADLCYEEFYSEPTCLVVRRGHPLAGETGLELEHLVDQPWLIPVQETALRRQIEAAFAAAGTRLPSNITESVSTLTNRALLQMTDCICVVPYHVVLADLKAGLLSMLPVKLQATTGPVGAITRKGQELPPAAQLLLNELRVIARTIES